MALTKERVAELVKTYGKSEQDSGSPRVQIALLTEQIRDLTEHLKGHIHDFHSRRGLLVLVGKRSRLLRFLEKTDRPSYLDLIQKLGLRK